MISTKLELRSVLRANHVLITSINARIVMQFLMIPMLVVTQELREDNSVLLETRYMLEEQLETCHKKIATVIDLESELVRCKHQLESMSAVRLLYFNVVYFGID